MQLQTTSPESKFPNEYSDVIFIQIDQHLKKLLQKYKAVPIFWITVSLCAAAVFMDDSVSIFREIFSVSVVGIKFLPVS